MTLHRAFGFPTRPLVRLLERELFGKHVLDVDIGRHSWIVHRYATGDGNIAAADALGRQEQIPLRPAYALTAHRVQGQTFDEVVFDPAPPRGRVAVPGMLYAMVSRCRTSTSPT